VRLLRAAALATTIGVWENCDVIGVGTLRRRRDLGDVVVDALSFYGQGFGRLFAIALPLLAYAVVSAVMLAALPEPISMLFWIVDLAAYAVIYGALIVAFASGRDEAADFGGAYRYVFQRLKPLLAAFFRSVLISMLFALTIVGIPWAINRIVRWLFVLQAVLLDNQPGEPALAFSSDAVKGHWWPTLFRMVAVGLIAFLPTALLLIVFGLEMTLAQALLAALLSAPPSCPFRRSQRPSSTSICSPRRRLHDRAPGNEPAQPDAPRQSTRYV
jgi:hypothetical protein